MSYSVNLLTTAAECDALLSEAEKEQSALLFRQASLERQLDSALDAGAQLSADLQATLAELEALTDVVAVLPEGKTRSDSRKKQKRLEVKQLVLADRQRNYGPAAQLSREYDLARVQAELAETTVFITAIQARKAAL